MTRPNVLDLFSGVGGMSLGFEQAGFDILASIELDPIHAAVHSFNFPMTRTICADIQNVQGQELVKSLRHDIDVVVGGPPCQGFSLIGQRIADDPRNRLISEFVRIVLEVQPSYFVMENVKGLTLGRSKKLLEELVETFEKNGFAIQTPWRVLNARDYAVPQDRQRLFIIGARNGKVLPSYPTAVESEPTVRDALDDLPNAENYKSLLSSDSVRTTKYRTPSKYAEQLRATNDSTIHFGYWRAWDASILTNSGRTNHTAETRRRFGMTTPGSIDPVSRFFRLDGDGVSNTLRAGTDSARGAHTSPRPIHHQYDRCITVREMARLHGFPDWFRFHVTKWHGARQIGNSVPPPLAKSVAHAIIDAMGIKPRSPKLALDMPSEELLRLCMTDASRYWDIETPIPARVRASTST